MREIDVQDEDAHAEDKQSHTHCPSTALYHNNSLR